MSSSESQGKPPAPQATPPAASPPPAPSSDPQPAAAAPSETAQAPAPGDAPVEAAAAAPSVPPAQAVPEPVEVNRIPVEYFRPSEIDGPLRALLVLFVIGFGVYVVNHWSKYDKYSGQTEQGWHKGSKQMVEITLVREDKNRLDCSSNVMIDGLGCGFDSNSQARALPKDKILHPYCNIKNDVLLASGLWESPGLQGQLPSERFTVVCNYNVVGVVKSVSLRWNPADTKFDPAKQSLPVGTLTDCVIPQ